MNAKKIMGAVLVALLAAALFVGAGVAAATDVNGNTVFVYQQLSNPNYTGTWTNGNNVVVIGDDLVISGDNIVEGTYKKGDDQITIKYPTATISGVATEGTVEYAFIGGVLYKEANWANITVSSPAGGAIYDILITFPDGSVKKGSQVFGTTIDFDTTKADDGIFKINLSNTNLSILPTGTYKLQALFNDKGDSGYAGTIPLVSYIPDNYLVGKDVFTVTIARATDATITANVDSVLKGDIVTITVTGKPGAEFTVENGTKFVVDSYGTVALNGSKIVIPNTGKAVLYMKAVETGEGKITVKEADVSVEIEVLEGEITAEADKDAYYIGNKVTLSGTSTAGSTLYFYIAGTNIGFKDLYDKATSGTNETSVENGEWEFEIAGDVFSKYDAGTYTIYVATNPGATQVKASELGTYTTVALVLKQPFISVTDAPSVAVKGTTYKVTGTAEAATEVYAYVFGTNFFAATNKTKQILTAVGDNITVDVKKNEFTIEVDIPEEADIMATGQYFMVVQHPMYDGYFNIWAENSEIVTAPTKGDALITANKTVLFDVDDRQKANAAQALCDALDTQNIDDMYVKLSFVVAAPQSVINPIPETVVQGEKLTVSGSTNMGKGVVVTVEMLSTAFASVPKETVGSAAFVSLTTKTDENGNWEITFDTSGLNVDEYTVTAAVDSIASSATAKVNVIEAADKPVDPEQPEQPTEPETPGFGALAALAGLGAVAVLLLRRE